MIRFDEFTFSLPRLWIAVCLLVLVDLICLGFWFRNPIALWLMHWLPRPLAGGMIFVGPFVAVTIWLVILILGVVFHGRHALWLVLPVLFFLPATYFQLIVWACAVYGSCP